MSLNQLAIYPRKCAMCDFLFHTEAAFYWHYVQEAQKDTRCMSPDEMVAYGFYYRNSAYETWGDRHRDYWDLDRALWSCLFKPAEIYGDLFPLLEIIVEPRWQRLLNEALYGKLSGMVAAWKGPNAQPTT